MGHNHKDIEYVVTSGSFEHTYRDPNEALLILTGWAMSRGKATLDILIHSKAGARAFAGDDAVKQYEEDPDASVFERYEFKCNALGRVP